MNEQRRRVTVKAFPVVKRGFFCFIKGALNEVCCIRLESIIILIDIKHVRRL